VSSTLKPRVALTLGDPAGIGPELIAKLLVRSDVIRGADVVLVGDAWLWEKGQAIAGVRWLRAPSALSTRYATATAALHFFSP
jgi:4-hydroxythreonine-4-phosphate dehydrogenase